MEYLRAHSGTRFDPRVVAEFTKMMSELPAEEPPMEGKEWT
jgi:HD-GYP domain-containing protein (c-di-GMP phosphodiesterase class II)